MSNRIKVFRNEDPLELVDEISRGVNELIE